MEGQTLCFWVPGNPAPAGSKRAFPHAKTGKMVVLDMSGPKGKAWRHSVQAQAALAMRRLGFTKPAVGPVEVVAGFFIKRPQSHLCRKRVKAWQGSWARLAGAWTDLAVRKEAPANCTKRPDLTKLFRAVEDSLTGIVWADDSQVVRQRVFKAWTCPRDCILSDGKQPDPGVSLSIVFRGQDETLSRPEAVWAWEWKTPEAETLDSNPTP